MITEDKVTGIFCMADDFCKSFDAMVDRRCAALSVRVEVAHELMSSRVVSFVNIFYQIIP